MKLQDVVLRWMILSSIFMIGFFFSGCQVVEGIFKAGMWVGIIVVVLLVLLVFWIMSKFRR